MPYSQRFLHKSYVPVNVNHQIPLMSNSIIILGGDFNAGHIDWGNYIIKPNADNEDKNENGKQKYEG